ncbi:hypothetical protein QBC44DRAFT_40353 [Cladorrhinum sp. PSN332]|nr:hypothetical protein QBC44DRAFT_40353 [Cladorrhinum sp. PSN332]
MDDPLPSSVGPAAYMTARGRQLRSTSVTSDPTRQKHQLRPYDDPLQNLTPKTAVEAIRNPMGALKACLDSATPSEQAFAIRAAIASNNIAEWLDELTSWPWPAKGGSSGFESPTSKRRRLSSIDEVPSAPWDPSLEEDKDYMGSLPAATVAMYEKRIDEISMSLDGLEIEEIKTQVLHHHIIPLSRPGTPLLDSGRSVTSALSTLARMDDLTALITATLMQALPNLSKLTRLMNVWSFRILVLRKVPVFLKSLADAEAALRTGWNYSNLGPKGDGDDAELDASPPRQPAVLSQKGYEVKKVSLERKVAKTGRDLDSMLDLLEGHQDTLPESWIDRVDSLEQEYGEWIVACEHKLREAHLTRIVEDTAEAEFDSGGSLPEDSSANEDETPSKTHSGKPKAGPHPGENRVQFLRRLFDTPVPVKKPAIKVFQPSDGSANRDPRIISVEPITPNTHIESPQSQAEQDRKLETDKESHLAFDGLLESSLPRSSLSEEENAKDVLTKNFFIDEEGSKDIPSYYSDTSDGYVSQPELPVLPRHRRASDMTVASTVVHDRLADFSDFSTDIDQGTPERFSRRDLNNALSPASEIRAPSSPPAFRSGARSMSVSFNDEPMITQLPSFSSSPKTPQTTSIFEDETPGSTGSPKTPMSATDVQLQQQISEILESVPAKIRLSSGLPSVNLNPPDFKMPVARKASKPEMHRSYSSMSARSAGSRAGSRAGTPSFTLAPAYGRTARQRPKPGNPEIKLYHLSRSNGEAPIKLFIRCVGERGERVMVRVGGGWADLGEYLKEYASHHGRRSAVGEGKVEVKDLPGRAAVGAATSMGVRSGSTPPSRPASAQEVHHSPISPLPLGGPLRVRKTRRATGVGSVVPTMTEEAKTPLSTVSTAPDSSNGTPSSGGSTRSRSSSRLSWGEEDSSLGMAGPRAKQIEMSEENKAWVESVKEKVRLASGERKASAPAVIGSAASSTVPADSPSLLMDGAKFGDMGKVGATKRVFRRPA